ncbi:MAG: alpha/beta fold hydrolase [Pseudomonadota bacterium]
MFAGIQHIEIRDNVLGIVFPAAVMYPTNTASVPTIFGQSFIELSDKAPISTGEYPLVVISHGNGGSHFIYATICTHLAKQGYIVAMLEHPGNNYKKNELEWTPQNLSNRPRHIRDTIDAVAKHPFFIRSVQVDNVAVIGHSLGGYTALAVAGGKPWSKEGQQIEVEADSRVRALVLLAPATPWYLPAGSLSNVTVPILMLVAEHDSYTPRWQSDIVLNGVPDKKQVTYRVVENAGHFSFISPFPLKMRSPSFLPSTDPGGFDREAFHQKLPSEIGEFLDKALKK